LLVVTCCGIIEGLTPLAELAHLPIGCKDRKKPEETGRKKTRARRSPTFCEEQRSKLLPSARKVKNRRQHQTTKENKVGQCKLIHEAGWCFSGEESICISGAGLAFLVPPRF